GDLCSCCRTRIEPRGDKGSRLGRQEAPGGYLLETGVRGGHAARLIGSASRVEPGRECGAGGIRELARIIRPEKPQRVRDAFSSICAPQRKPLEVAEKQ